MNEMMKMIMNSSLREIVCDKPDDGKQRIIIGFHVTNTEPQKDPDKDEKDEHQKDTSNTKEAWDDFPDLNPDTRPEDLSDKQIEHLVAFMADMYGIRNSASDDGDEDEES